MSARLWSLTACRRSARRTAMLKISASKQLTEILTLFKFEQF
jgi:hypothetical protein